MSKLGVLIWRHIFESGDAEGLHQGDHLHPNARGGQKLADAFDLEKLTGKEA